MSLDRERLRKVLALLASPHQGEQQAALAAVQRVLQAAGMRFEDLAAAPAATTSAADVAALRQKVHSAALVAMAQQQKIDGLSAQVNLLRAEREQMRARAMLAEQRLAQMQAQMRASSGTASTAYTQSQARPVTMEQAMREMQEANHQLRDYLNAKRRGS